MATARPKGAPSAAKFKRASRGTKSSFAQFNALAKGRGAKGARGGSKALSGGGDG